MITLEEMMLTSKALNKLRPGARYAVDENGIQWQDDEVDEPSQEEIDAAIVEISAEEPLKKLRQERNRRLATTDWVSGTDVPESLKAVWNPYRQALRDITDNYTSLEEVVWPDKP
jgi:hypothetical protein